MVSCLSKLSLRILQRQIEEASPQIIGHDAEIWTEFIKKDVQDWKEKFCEPKNPKNWYKVYRKLLRESETQIKKDQELLEAKLKGISAERSNHRMQRVELDGVKLAGDMVASGPTIRVMGPNPRFIDRWTGKPPTQKQLKIERGVLDPNGQRKVAPKPTIMDKFRKDAKAMARFPSQQPPKEKKPTGVIIRAHEMTLKPKIIKNRVAKPPPPAPAPTRVMQVPPGLLAEYRQAARVKPIDPTIPPPQIFNPKKRKIEHDADEASADQTRQAKEKRLKALTNPRSLSSPAQNTSAKNLAPPLSSTVMPKSSPLYQAPKAATYIKAPRSRTATPVTPSPESSPPAKTVGADGDTREKSPPILKLTPDMSSRPSSANQKPLTPLEALSRANTASPRNESARPPLKLKRKAEADIFMQPKKKRQLA